MGEFYLILLFDFVVLDEYANIEEILWLGEVHGPQREHLIP